MFSKKQTQNNDKAVMKKRSSYQTLKKEIQPGHTKLPVGDISRAQLDSHSLSQQDVMYLQRVIGNQNIGGLLADEGHITSHASSKAINEISAPLQGKMNGGENHNDTDIMVQTKQKRDIGGNLPDDVQMKMEKSFEADFSNVKVHENSATAKELDAVSYTQGDEIHFAPGYSPYSSQGQEYLGHELSHVIQQRSGRVETTHQELGFNVNSDTRLEREADNAGIKAASGQKAGLNMNGNHHIQNTAVQKKTAPLQLKRLLPSGAPLFDLRIDIGRVLNAFDIAYAAVGRSLSVPLVGSISSHSVLASQIREICGGNYFRSNNYWSSDWEDDEFPDYLALGVWDVDVKAEMTMYIDNERVIHLGPGAHSSSGTGGQARTRSGSTTVGGSATGSIGGHEGAPGAEAGVSASSTSATSTTITSTGSGGLVMTMPSQASMADVLIECSVTADPTLGVAKRKYWTAQGGSNMSVILGSAVRPASP